MKLLLLLYVAVVQLLVLVKGDDPPLDRQFDARNCQARYISFNHYGRLSNRYLEARAMAMLAFHLNRTLVTMPYEGIALDEIYDFKKMNENLEHLYQAKYGLDAKAFNHGQPFIMTFEDFYTQHFKIDDSKLPFVKVNSCLKVSRGYYHQGTSQPRSIGSGNFYYPQCQTVVSPFLPKEIVPLTSILQIEQDLDPFIAITGEWVFHNPRDILVLCPPHMEVLFQLSFLPSIWEEALYVKQVILSNSTNAQQDAKLMSLHIRLEDMAKRYNLVSILEGMKQEQLQKKVAPENIFIATNGNDKEIAIIRKYFPDAVIELCADRFASKVPSCFSSNPVRKIAVTQALASLAEIFTGSDGSSFTYLINLFKYNREEDLLRKALKLL